MELKNRKKEERKKGEIYMNFKKVLSIASVASLAVVGLASCGKKEKTIVDGEYVGKVNVAATYGGIGYVTYGRGTNNLGKYTTVDGRNLTPNKTLAPIWQDIATNMNVKLQDAALSASSTACAEEALITAKYKGYKGRKADLLQTTTGDTFTTEVNNGNILNLLPYINNGSMPNLKKWLDEHPAVKEQLTMSVGDTQGIYYTPYFDGLDQNEQQLNMNIDMVKALLDSATEQTETSKLYYDQAKTGAFDTGYVYENFKYNTPFIASMDSDVAVARQSQTGLDDGADKQDRVDDNDVSKYTTVSYVADKINVKIESGQDIITKMNNLTTKDGASMVACLKDYLNAHYGKYVGKGKLYAHLSDIFISTSACYNTDELIALLRCIKANPAWLTGKADTTMIPFFPRTGEDGRVRRLISFMQIFGIRGLEGEKDRYWITADGKLTDGRSQEMLLKGLDNIWKLQQDKLFPETKGWTTDGSTTKGDFRSTQLADGTAFMCNDMANVAAFNNDATGKGKCYNITGVLPPVSMWGFTQEDGSNTAKDGVKTVVGAKTGFSYTRFSEDDRSLKPGGWGVVASSVKNSPEKLAKILKIMDYMYTPEGSVLECFGYNAQASEDQKSKAFTKRSAGEKAATKYDGSADDYLATDASGNYYVNVNSAYIAEKTKLVKGTWHNYMTQYWGSCLGIGNIRTNYLESQLTSPRQKMGVAKLTNARGTGAYYLATTTGKNYLKVVNTNLNFTEAMKTANDTNGKELVNFWNQKAGSEYYTIAEKGWSSAKTYKTPQSVKDLFAKYNSSVLTNAGTVWGFTVDSTDQFSYITDKTISA